MKVMIATPSRDGNYCQGYVSGLMQVQHYCNMNEDVQMIWAPMKGCSNIYAGRDQLAAWFMERSNYDVLLWIDSDTGFNLKHFKKMIESIKEGYLLGCALQPKKMPAAVYGKDRHLHQTATGFYVNEKGHVCCESAGFGFFFVTREAFREAQKRSQRIYVRVESQNIATYGYHMAICENDVVYSEDISFCKRLKEDFIVVMDCKGVDHEGSHVFEGMFYDEIKKSIFDAQNDDKNAS